MSSELRNSTALKDAQLKDLLLEKAELEFVQIIIIIVVITVMVIVIICLLNHYKLSTRSFINRQSQNRRQEETLQPSSEHFHCPRPTPGSKKSPAECPRRHASCKALEGCLWPSDSSVSQQGASEIMYAPRSRDRFTTPSFMQRDRFSRFQPTYPYMQHEIDLPPTISLSDGEEPPPYQGPCTLQLRDPEQQMELNRESVRAPPNRTIFDSDLIDISMYNGGPCPPSSNSGISATNYSSNGRMEGPPPTYSEVMGNYPGSSFFHHQHSNAPPSSQRGSRHQFQQNNSESTIVSIKGKDRKPGNLV
uniref:Low density lipoprotein receptor class A domain containing 4 n=1 Tax=Gopherus evgoodei TaxID=1825980 RepID=A0A8C4YA50_9SAUR